MRINKMNTQASELKQAIVKFRQTRKTMASEIGIAEAKKKLAELNCTSTTPSNKEFVPVSDTGYEKIQNFFRRIRHFVLNETKTNDSNVLSEKEIKSLYDKNGDLISRSIIKSNNIIAATEKSIQFPKYPNGTSYVVEKFEKAGVKYTRYSGKGRPTLIEIQEPYKITNEGIVAISRTISKHAHINKSPLKLVEVISKRIQTKGSEIEKKLLKKITMKDGTIIKKAVLPKGELIVEQRPDGTKRIFKTPEAIDDFIKKQDKHIQEGLIFI